MWLLRIRFLMWLKVSSHNKAWINLNLGEFYQQSITNNELVHVVKKT
jgi:hypothetical protein